jgi:hypothetical protein
MLTFAANFFLSGLDPFWPKVTNIGIHLLNGLALFLLLREVLAFRALDRNEIFSEPDRFAIPAALLAGIWLVLPINVTAVAYVSQRMETLANLFVFFGLYRYVKTRRETFTAGRRSAWKLFLYLLIFTIAGVCAKESAILLPVLAACFEFAIPRFRNMSGKIDTSIVGGYFAMIGLPAALGVAWLVGWIFTAAANLRTFSIGERLLTEPRVLFDYIGWILFPNLNSLTFYHDDFVVSHNLFDPVTTFFAIAGVLACLSTALVMRQRKPLLCLGILWFFAGHSLTATIIPLELVFEHRNYFPSVGVLLALTSLVATESPLKMPRLPLVAGLAFLCLSAFVTTLRAQEWSNPLRLALSETLKRPGSSRAAYDFARTLIVAAGSDEKKSGLIQEAVLTLSAVAERSDSGIAPFQALIYLNARSGKPINADWWTQIIGRLRDRPPSQTDVGVLIFLSNCQMRQVCPAQTDELLQAFTEALTRSNGDPNLTSAYAHFAYEQLRDPELAERMYRAVVAAKPQVPVYRANLARFLLRERRFDEAAATIRDLSTLSVLGSLDKMLEELNDDAARAKREADPDSRDAPGANPGQRSLQRSG